MKLAILGHSPLALETALRFHLHGAALTWYVSEGDHSGFDSGNFSPNSFTTDLGFSVLKEMDAHYSPKTFSWSEWSGKYEKPLTDYLKAHQEVKFDEVVSITKRFLAPGEVIPDRSRFLDLFRVIYHVNPKDFIEGQKETNPETFERLSQEFINSLASTIEMYQDYDLVLDFRNDLGKASAATSGRALGESREANKVHYALKALELAKSLKPVPEVRELALIGSDSLSVEILLNLTEWIKDPASRMFIVTTEEEPFAKFLSEANPLTSSKLHELLSYIENEFEKDVETFTHKLREWQELDDFVQAKIPKPAEPIPRLNFFSGHNVSAIDELIDRKRMFLTLEKPEFRFGKKHPENNFVDLKTVGVDQVLVAHAKKNLSMIQLDRDEKGFFNLTPLRPTTLGSWEKDLLNLEGVENEIFKLFSPADTH
jgi:hypothetical protein